MWKLRSRVKLITQYEWNDDRTFPTGLHFITGRPKPSYFQFPNPQLRVTFQVRPRGASAFRSAGSATTDSGGYFARTMRALGGAAYRYQYVTAAGTVTSQTFTTPRS